MDTDPETTDYIRERPIDMSSSFDYGDELPEIQQNLENRLTILMIYLEYLNIYWV
jgi:hypothetical protein